MTKLVMICSAMTAAQQMFYPEIMQDQARDHANISYGFERVNGLVLVQLQNAKVYPTNIDEIFDSPPTPTIQASQIKKEPVKHSFSEVQEVTARAEDNNYIMPIIHHDTGSVKSLSVKLENKLQDAADAGHLLRFRITLFTTLFGASLILIAMVVGSRVQTGSRWHFSLIPLGSVFVLSGLMPEDILIIRAVSSVFIIFALIGAVFTYFKAYSFWFVDRDIIREYGDDMVLDPCGANLPDGGCLVAAIGRLIGATINLLVFVYMCPNLSRVKGTTFFKKTQKKGARYQQTPQNILHTGYINNFKTFLLAVLYIGMQGSLAIVIGTIQFFLGDRSPFYTNDQFAANLFNGSFSILIAAFMNSNNRRMFTAFLASMTTTADTRNAAGIAALMGSISATDGLSMAKEKFCAIPFDKLKESDFDDNTENEQETNTLFEHTESVALGRCDAFLSHSWQDNGKKKYEALSKWAEEFKVKHGRYPLIWLDKACVDQNNIANDLMCLPIFLAGCNTLLIIPGPTYTSRLWCVMEVFVFLHMGGNIQRIKVLPIDMRDSQQVSDIFSSVDVSKCLCHLEEDKQRLLGVVQMGFGSFSSFNDTVRNMFNERLSSFCASHMITDRSQRQEIECRDLQEQETSSLEIEHMSE